MVMVMDDLFYERLRTIAMESMTYGGNDREQIALVTLVVVGVFDELFLVESLHMQ